MKRLNAYLSQTELELGLPSRRTGGALAVGLSLASHYELLVVTVLVGHGIKPDVVSILSE